MNVCQPGVEGILPSWCVEFETGSSFIIQGIIEVVILLFFGLIMYKGFRYMRKRKTQKRKLTKGFPSRD